MLKTNKKYLLNSIAATLIGLSSWAQAEIAVIVSPNSSIGTVSEREVARVYLGKSNTLDGTKVKVTVQQSKLDIAEKFSRSILDKSPNKMQAQWSKLIFTGKRTPPTELDGDAQVIETVKRDPNTVGYIDSDSVTNDVKVIFKK